MILKYLVSDTSHKWVLSRRKWIGIFTGRTKSRADLEQVAVVEREGTGKIGMDPPLVAKRRQSAGKPNPTPALDERCPSFHYDEWRIRE